FEVNARDCPLDSYSKWIFADFRTQEGDAGRNTRSRTAAYESTGKRWAQKGALVFSSFAGYSDSDGRLVGEQVSVSFADYDRGLAAVLDELSLLPGEWREPTGA